MIKYNTLPVMIIALSCSISLPILSNDKDVIEIKEMTNLQIVKNIYAGFAAGDTETILKDMSETIVWTHPGNPNQIPFAGKFEGKSWSQSFF